MARSRLTTRIAIASGTVAPMASSSEWFSDDDAVNAPGQSSEPLVDLIGDDNNFRCESDDDFVVDDCRIGTSEWFDPDAADTSAMDPT